MAEDMILVRQEGAVVELVLNRPDRMNALSRALIARLIEIFEDLADDPQVRAVVLTGAGKAFTVGVDLKELGAADDVGTFFHGQANPLFETVRGAGIPVIAAVNGFAITGGLELALMADMILAADTAVFADTHARVGITPSWGMTQILPRLIGPNRARQMSLTGEFVPAATAERWGLVNEVTAPADLLPRAHALAAQIAETDPVTMTRVRGLIATSQEVSLAEGLAAERTVFAEHIATVTPDAVSANRDKVVARGRALNSG
ncbi:enoyl-CoA hydratase [Chachezhania sediminis]|uniref:enoyl-CoA hydratase n=1 Tax=Chachezhania sediminis TaxID=2599291 RepID=UPI0018EEFDE4|nr:enoyl-CoA hydratase [Chachezhania sediminis]